MSNQLADFVFEKGLHHLLPVTGALKKYHLFPSDLAEAVVLGDYDLDWQLVFDSRELAWSARAQAERRV
jgi:hypothetical protein